MSGNGSKLMALTKAETWALAERIGGAPLVELIVEASRRVMNAPWYCPGGVIASGSFEFGCTCH